MEPQVDGTADEILLLLAKRSGIDLPTIAGQLGLNKEVAAFHVEELENQGLVYGSFNIMEPARYSLDQEGRRHLIKKGLLK